MSGTSEQIIILFEQGNTPESIATMLELDLSDILIILNGAGRLSKKKIERNITMNAIITTGDIDNKQRENSFSQVNDNKESAEAIYKQYHAQIARRIVNTALSEPDETLPASVIQKAQLYINEEATGRNDARAKKSSAVDHLLITLGEMANHAKIAQERVNKALGIPSIDAAMNKAIEVKSERVA